MLRLVAVYLFTDVLSSSSRVKKSKQKLDFLTPQMELSISPETSVKKYEVVSRIFWVGAAIYTAVVVARSTGMW
jgi:hypothetical protein